MNAHKSAKRLYAYVAGAVSALVYACVPFIAYAAECAGGQGFCNPLNSSFSSIPAFLAGALKVMVMVAIPLITLFVVISGFMFIMARGNASKLEKAKQNFVYVILGALLILGAWVIAELIGGTVTQLIGR